MSSAELLAIADRVYAAPATEFVAVRDAESRACTDKDLARQVKALRKPSVAAWAVNLLVRRESTQIDQVLALAGSLRAAAESLDGEELRTLTRQRRQLTAALTQTARELAREYDVRLTAAVADQVETMLNAAMLDPVAAAVLRSGLVVTAFSSTGVSDLDVAAVCAVPEAAGHQAAPVERQPPSLHVVSDEPVRREQARERLHEATLARAAAEHLVEELEARIERARARRLQLGGEIDELRRRIAVLEDEVDGVDDDLEEAESALQDAQVERDEALAEHDEAEQALADLG